MLSFSSLFSCLLTIIIPAGGAESSDCLSVLLSYAPSKQFFSLLCCFVWVSVLESSPQIQLRRHITRHPHQTLPLRFFIPARVFCLSAAVATDQLETWHRGFHHSPASAHVMLLTRLSYTLSFADKLHNGLVNTPETRPGASVLLVPLQLLFFFLYHTHVSDTTSFPLAHPLSLFLLYISYNAVLVFSSFSHERQNVIHSCSCPLTLRLIV